MTADTVGGVWTYALELAASLAPHGVEIALATMGAPPTSDQRLALERLPHVELFESAYRLEWMEEPWEDLARAGDWLLEVAARFGPDLVHLNGYHHADLPWGRPVVVVAHSCVLTWWRAVKGEPAPPAWDRYRDGVARGLAAAAQVVAPTAALLEAMEREYGPLEEARVVPNARDPGRFMALGKDPVIMGAGRVWDEAKNLARLVEVAPSLSWQVCLAGPVERPGGAVDRAERADRVEHIGGGGRPGGDRVRYLGRLSELELARWLGRASIFALPALYEPFGLSALEAALAGCALVLGDIPSLREVWGDAAYFVPPSDPIALRDGLEGVANDLMLRSELAVRARRRALEYLPERQASGYLEVYEAVVSQGALVRSQPVDRKSFGPAPQPGRAAAQMSGAVIHSSGVAARIGEPTTHGNGTGGICA